jgi:dipeptidyl aminopeptidase/acylaminoacyl peptidase
MKRLPLSCLAALCAFCLPFLADAARVEQGSLILDGLPPRDAALAGNLGRYLEARQASVVDWLADGSLLVSTRFADAEQLHRVRGPMGAREQLTFERDPVRAATPLPFDATSFVYSKDQDGNENAQLYLQRIGAGAARLLTDGRSLHGEPVFAQDGKRLAFHSNARDGASYDIYVSDLTRDAPPRLVLGGGSQSLYVQDWSMDDARLLVIRYVSITESYLYVADVATGRLTPIEPGEKPTVPVRVSQARFSRDGRGIYYLTDRGGEFTELRYVDMFTNETRAVAPQDKRDVESFALGRDGRYLAYTLNEGGLSRLVVHDIAQQADVLLPALPPGAIIGRLAFDPRGRRLALSVESAQQPRDAWVLDLEGDRPQLARWTQSEIGPVDASTLVPAQLVSFPTWDRVGTVQRQLAAFVYRPTKPGPHPVLIDIHGGPESQYRPGWNAFTQFLVNELGYVVVAPNVRGSSGYGRSFLKLDDGKLREDAVRDIGSLLVWIGLQPDVDRSRIAVTGGSYGGYLSLASQAMYADRLAGGIDIVGISNFVTFLTNTSAYRRDLRRAEYGDERNVEMRAFLQRISPLTNARSIRKPLLIVQGLNDPRVPASESEQMLAAVRANGGDVWYLAAKDEGHGFRKKGNRDAYLEAAAQFLRGLAGDAAR